MTDNTTPEPEEPTQEVPAQAAPLPPPADSGGAAARTGRAWATWSSGPSCC